MLAHLCNLMLAVHVYVQGGGNMYRIRGKAGEPGPSTCAISLIALSTLVWSSLSLGREQAPLVDWTSVGDQMSPVIVRRMADDQIPGVILVVVKGARVVLSAGYGVAVFTPNGESSAVAM